MSDPAVFESLLSSRDPLRDRNPVVLLSTCAVVVAAALASDPARAVDFSRDIRPILAAHCFNCHGRDAHSRQADLRLDERPAALATLPSGTRAIVPGSIAESELAARIESTDSDIVMPPPEFKKPLTAEQKKLLREWIAANAPYAPHWSFEPICDPEPPQPPVALAGWPTDPLDRFVADRLAREGLQPAQQADRETWLRRVTLDLTGLPPTPEERAAFLADESADARERVVDRLLASPRHAEKMALHWLDVARYADTNGYNNDEERAQWPWRDWVIDAFARNMPFDRFVIEQLAGDLLPEPTRAQRIATGFGRNHVLTTEGGVIQEEYRVEYVADRVQTTFTAFMGLTLQCARCHDHKFDPISQREYFQLFAFFNNIPDPVVPYGRGKLVNVVEPFVQLRSHADEAALIAINDRLGNAKPDDATAAEIAAIENRTVKVMVMADLPEPRQAHVLDRGQYDAPRDPVAPGVPAFLPPLPEGAAANRLALALWLVDPRHPLTARVAVNRWWEMLFGRGLVETVEDFGTQGAAATHPDLLDHLATSLIREGWDVRRLLRRIVLSATYRQASRAPAESFARDPDNRLLSRGPRFRLPAEMVRDQAIFASGLLVERVGGPSVKPWQPAGLWEEVSVKHQATYVPDQGEGLHRRSMYTFWKRTCPPPSMALFDAPDRETCVVRRARTNTPLQALVVMNDPTYVEAAKALALRGLGHAAASRYPGMTAAASDAAVVDHLYHLLLARWPSVEERAAVLEKLAEFRRHFAADTAAARKLLARGPDADQGQPADLAAWTMVASTLLCLDETLTKE
jgi:hypothetical protein